MNTNTPEWLVVFRTGTNQDEETTKMLYQELQSGSLRQGWGGAGLSLMGEDGEQISKAQWVENYRSVWEEEPSSRRYSALTPMLDLRADDIVVIPKLPENDTFSVARVSGEYKFIEDDHVARDDFRHVIPVDENSVRSFHKHSSEDAYAVYSLFSRANHRYPVTFAYDKNHINAAMKLLDQESDLSQAHSSEDLVRVALDSALDYAAGKMQEKVKGWNGGQFQSAVQSVFENQGYEVIKNYRHYDGKGADADIVVRPPSNHAYSLFMPTEIAVQVKWKQGIDSDDVHAVKQLVAWKESDAVQKFVISSADEFTPDCKKLAEESGVTLIGGLNTMYFLMGVPKFETD